MSFSKRYTVPLVKNYINGVHAGFKSPGIDKIVIEAIVGLKMLRLHAGDSQLIGEWGQMFLLLRIWIHCRRWPYFSPYWVVSRYLCVAWLMGLLPAGTGLIHVFSKVLHILAEGCFCRYIKLQGEGYKYNLIHFLCIHNDKMMCI